MEGVQPFTDEQVSTGVRYIKAYLQLTQEEKETVEDMVQIAVNATPPLAERDLVLHLLEMAAILFPKKP